MSVISSSGDKIIVNIVDIEFYSIVPLSRGGQHNYQLSIKGVGNLYLINPLN